MNAMLETPHNLDAERAVLGAILLRNELLLDASDALRPDDFFRDAHRVLFGAMLRLAQQGRAIDPLTLQALLGADDYERAGGALYVSRLVDGVPHSRNVSHYCQIVREQAKRRELIAAGRNLIDQALHADDPEHVHERAEEALRALHLRGGMDGFADGGQIAERALVRVEAWQAPGLPGLPTGLAALDAATCGLHPSELIVVGARPGMGKSALAAQIAWHGAVVLGHPVAYFSLEMPVEEVGVRMVAAHAGVPYRSLMRGQASDTDLRQVSAASARLAASPLLIDDATDTSVAAIRRACRVRHGKRPLRLIVVDYLTLLSGVLGEQHGTRTLEVGSWARRLKWLAKELHVPVLLCCQLNRASDQGRDRQPRLSDLRDSGEIEQHANVVLFPHHDIEDGHVRPAVIDVAKQRNGPIGPVSVRFNGPLTRFEERGA